MMYFIVFLIMVLAVAAMLSLIDAYRTYFQVKETENPYFPDSQPRVPPFELRTMPPAPPAPVKRPTSSIPTPHSRNRNTTPIEPIRRSSPKQERQPIQRVTRPPVQQSAPIMQDDSRDDPASMFVPIAASLLVPIVLGESSETPETPVFRNERGGDFGGAGASGSWEPVSAPVSSPAESTRDDSGSCYARDNTDSGSSYSGGSGGSSDGGSSDSGNSSSE